jgi:hypothetical protein
LQELQHRIEELNKTLARLRDLGKDDTYNIREYSEALTQLNF